MKRPKGWTLRTGVYRGRPFYRFSETIGGERFRKWLGPDRSQAIEVGGTFLSECTTRVSAKVEASRPRPMTFAAFTKDRWAPEFLKQENPNGYDQAMQRFRDHLEPRLGDLTLDQLDDEGVLRQWVASLLN